MTESEIETTLIFKLLYRFIPYHPYQFESLYTDTGIY